MIYGGMMPPVLQGRCFMEGIPALYNGQVVSKANFRAYIYSPDGNQKLVNSWDEFETNMQTGLWFAKKEEANQVKQDVKPERTKKQKKLYEEIVKDDFSPKEQNNGDNS
jgi:hypothetical protein